MPNPVDRGNSEPETKTVIDVVRRRATAQPSAIAYRFWPRGDPTDDAMTFGELAGASASLASGLRRLASPGDRVVLAVSPGPDFVTAFYGALMAGCVAVPVAPVGPRSASPIDGVAEHCGAVAVVTSRPSEPRPPVPGIPPAHVTISRLQSVDRDDLTRPTIEETDLALLQYTSGSTGTPRGIRVTHGNLMANLRALQQRLEPGADASGLVWLPPFHDMGLVGGILMPMYQGRPMTLMSARHFAARPIRWLRAMALSGCTHTAIPNFALDHCVDRTTEEEREALDLSSLRSVLCGAEPVQGRSLRRFTRAFEPSGFDPSAFVAAYGLAENTLMVSTSAIGLPPQSITVDAASIEAGTVVPAKADHPRAVELVSVGSPTKDTEVTVADPTTDVACGPGQIGEIRVRGPSVADGCWGDTKATARAFVPAPDRSNRSNYGRQLRTGDLGFVLDNRLFVTGRIDDVINMRGRKFQPEQLEETASAAVADLGVVGQGVAFGVDRAGTRRLVYVQGLGRDRTAWPDNEELARAIRTSLARIHQVAVNELLIVQARSLPRTRSGKVRRNETRQRLLEGRLRHRYRWVAGETEAGPALDGPALDGPVLSTAANAEADAETDVTSWLLAVVARLVGVPEAGIERDTALGSLGLDSLHLALICHEVESRFAVDDLMAKVTVDTTVDELADLIADADSLEPGHSAGVEPTTAEPTTVEPRSTPAAAAVPWEVAHHKLSERMATLDEIGVANPFQRTVHEVSGSRVEIDGRSVVNFAAYDYLGLNGDPEVKRAAIEAIERFGTSVSASRVVSGDRPSHRELESAIARFLSIDAAVIFVSGGLTNISTIGHLVGPADLIVHDSLAHNSITAGARLSGATRRIFPHNDIDAVDRILAETRSQFRHVLVIVEGLYSMDGDIPDLARLVSVKKRHDAMLMVDEAHSLGVLGSTGRGLAEYCAVDPREVDVWMGTLSKSLAACGGYIAGSSKLVEYLRYTSPGYVFSVGLSPPDTAAALAALGRLVDQPERVRVLSQRARLLRDALAERGVTPICDPGSAIVPVIIGETAATILVSNRMLDLGFNVPPVVAPAVGEHLARLRFFVSAGHTANQVLDAADALIQAFTDYGIDPSTVNPSGR